MSNDIAQTVSQSPVWIKEMRAHRDRTGEYRNQDILRVLGDPRTPVIITATGSFVASSQTASNVVKR